jgi:pimeloyl-ACP methyl ester carboxylesterase
VAEAIFEVRGRHTDVIPVRVVFPSDTEGRPRPAAEGTGAPALVFVQGGLVAPGQYLWLAEELAARGFVVALPSHAFELALSSVDNGHFTRELLVEPPRDSLLEGLVDARRIGVAGHSLGGVVATKLALDGGFGALALLASFPDPADDSRLPSLGVPSLALAGEEDCQAPLEVIREEASHLPRPSLLVSLQGVSHYQFTAEDRKDAERGCPPHTGLEEAHTRIAEVLHRFLRAALETGGTGAEDIRAVPGVEVTEP